MRRLTAATITVLLLTFSATAAVAAWRVDGEGAAVSAAASLQPPTEALATPGTSSVTVTWAPSLLPDGNAVDGYRVTRYASQDPDGSPAQGTCAGLVASSPCNDTGLAGGTYTYGIAAQQGTYWQSTEVPTTGVTVAGGDTTGPGILLTTPTDTASYGRGWPGAFAGSVAPTGDPVVSVEVALRRDNGMCWNPTGVGFDQPCSAPSVFRPASLNGSAWSLHFDGFVSGNRPYTAVVRATDSRGNVTVTPVISFSVNGA